METIAALSRKSLPAKSVQQWPSKAVNGVGGDDGRPSQPAMVKEAALTNDLDDDDDDDDDLKLPLLHIFGQSGRQLRRRQLTQSFCVTSVSLIKIVAVKEFVVSVPIALL